MNNGNLIGGGGDTYFPMPPVPPRRHNSNEIVTKPGVARNVLIIGVLGSGKSTLYKCITQSESGGPNHSMTEEAEFCENTLLCREGHAENIVTNVFDTKGFHGNWKHDKKTLEESISRFQSKLGEVHRIYFVIKRNRDKETGYILEYADYLISPQAKQICMFVITSCTPSLEQRIKADLKEKYAAFFSNVRDNQFIFVNLPDYETAETEACRNEFSASWEKARLVLLDDVASAHEVVPIDTVSAVVRSCSIS